MISEEKQKALEAALGNIEKQFGKGSVMKLGDSSSHMQVEAVPTGCLSLDICPWCRWCSQGTYRGDLRTGVQW